MFFQNDYRCKHLILTTLFNQKEDYSAIDISKLEEKSIIHFIIGVPMPPPRWMPGASEMMTDYQGEGHVFLEEGGMWCFE